jgi:hypothetical protein
MAAGTNIWLSRTATNNAIPLAPAISRDGRRVAFTGPDAPPGTARSLYIYDTATGTFQTVKHPVSATYDPSLEEVAISADGEHVAWISEGQLYLYDVASQTESLISTAPDGTPANSEVSDISISDNGSVVLFTSTATNLSPGTSGDASELYRWDRTAGNVALLSTSVSGGGSESDVIFPVLSGDGSTAGFMSFASDLVPGDDYTVNDVYVVGTSGTNTVRLVSAPGGVPPSSTASGGSAVPPQAVSANGRIVVFASTAPDLVPNDNNFESDVFAYDVQSRTIRLISTAPDGVHSVPGGASFALLSPGPMGGGVVSDDGNVVVFSALAPGATNAAQRAYYAADLRLGTNRVASVLPDGSLAPGLYGGVLSGDGRYFAFETNIGFNSPLFVRDLEEQRTAVYPPVGPDQLSISTHGEYIGVQNATRFLDRMKSNYFTLPAGARVVSLPLDGKVLRAGQRTLELYNLAENTFRLISTNYADSIVFSRNGKFAVYLQRPVSSQLFFPYLLDLSTAESRLLFENADTNITFRYSAPSSVSDDGRYVAFISTNGIAGTEASTNSFGYLYRFDRAETNVTLISRSITGALPLYPSSRASMSADGSVIVFHSGSPDIVPGDRNRASDVFVYRASVASGDQNRNGIDDAWEVAHFGQANVDPQADADGDGATNLQEYLAGTDPRDAQSALRLSMHASSGATLEWFGVAGKRYQVQFRASLSEGAWQNLGNPVTGQGRIVQLPANGGEAAAGFYRVVLVE